MQDGLTGSAWGDWANYTASPLRAFENELGVQEPVGFWDPAGFTVDGSVENFKRRRQTELKHGRISMLATMGYITPEQLVKATFMVGYMDSYGVLVRHSEHSPLLRFYCLPFLRLSTGPGRPWRGSFCFLSTMLALVDWATFPAFIVIVIVKATFFSTETFVRV